MKRITQEELNAIIEKHRKWLNHEKDGERANLEGANMSGANMSGADMSYANMRNADMHGANMSDADMSGAIIIFPICCPDTGSFIGWKKVRGEYIAQLEIPEDAKRLSATGRKCRCDKTKVLSIQNADGTPADVQEAASLRDETFLYRVGEIVSVENFDENRWNECSTGIHFFITRQEAVDYH